MHEYKTEFEIKVMARVLEVSSSGYYAWVARSKEAEIYADKELCEVISGLREESRNSYGYRSMTLRLRGLGKKVNRKRTYRIMKEQGWLVERKKKYVKTTNSLHQYPTAPNLLNRDFSANNINEKWITDITYVRTSEGWLYVCAVLDVFSSRIVGWAAQGDMSETLVLKALKMAFEQRRPSAGLIVHSDRGVQYAAQACRDLLKSHQVRQSMSGKGDCYDNAMMESWNARFKVEWVRDYDYVSRELGKLDVFTYIETHYNRRRPMARLGGLSPIQFENKHVTEFRNE